MSGPSALLNWLWLFYQLALVTLVLWTAVLFFRQRSKTTTCMLAAALLFAIATLIGSAISWLGPLFGFSMSWNPNDGAPAHFDVMELAWRLSFLGALCFQAALWFVLRRKDESAKRIEELEEALQQSFGPQH